MLSITISCHYSLELGCSRLPSGRSCPFWGKIIKYSDFLLQNVWKRPESCRTCRGWTVNLPDGFPCLRGTSETAPGAETAPLCPVLERNRRPSPLPIPMGSPIASIGRGHQDFRDHEIFKNRFFFDKKSKFQKTPRLISRKIVLLDTPKFAAYRSPWRSLGKSYKIPTRNFTGKPRRCLVLLGFTKVSLVKPSIYGFPTQIPGRHFVRFP